MVGEADPRIQRSPDTGLGLWCIGARLESIKLLDGDDHLHWNLHTSLRLGHAGEDHDHQTSEARRFRSRVSGSNSIFLEMLVSSGVS